MTLRDRLAVIRETRQIFQKHLDAQTASDPAAREAAAIDATTDEMKTLYGANVDWAKILEIVMTILTLLSKFLV